MKRKLSHIFLIFGVLCIVSALILLHQRTSPARVAFAMEEVKTKPIVEDEERMPAYLRIQSLDINLQIFPAQIVDNTWDATTEGVSYLVSSPLPGETGNSVIYGHNFPNLLGKLPEIKPGDEIQVGFNNYTQQAFIVERTDIVSPSETGILLPSNDKRLTLYTCTGFLDTKRFVVIALAKKSKLW